MNPLRVAAERAAHLAGDMLAAGDDDAPPAPPPLTLAELHALESDGGITLPELAAEAAVLDRLAVLTAQLGSPWEAAKTLFTLWGQPGLPENADFRRDVFTETA